MLEAAQALPVPVEFVSRVTGMEVLIRFMSVLTLVLESLKNEAVLLWRSEVREPTIFVGI